uniref:Troponin I n=1 Tax=Globodera pallida TaxID=36090 RepID=A0A183BQJ3_GLOPA
MGGGDDESEAQRRKNDERERKKAEVRKRLEEAGRMKKAKKGFLTPERKKKLRKLLMLKAAEDLKKQQMVKKLLMLKAAEDLKKQQMVKEQERQDVLSKRIVALPDLDSRADGELQRSGKEFADRIVDLESEKYDLSYTVRQKDFEINELTIAVNDLRGKFVKPTLKKVSKTEGQFAKLKTKEGQKLDFRNNLKTVEKKQFALDEKDDKIKVEWSKS